VKGEGIERADRCPDCDWRVPAVPLGMSEGLALSALLDHQFYDCAAGPQAQAARPLSAEAVVSS
jgi:hypothetical protein